uniref:Tankyrase 1-binding protein C-terminal domain-containing protein n=1 Tax=Mastacembelus armatus TaxID=205130 RepID=A0A3Q3KZR6_9TELE
MPSGPEAGQWFGAISKESSPSGEMQTVRASLFENVVERHIVLMADEAKPIKKTKDLLSSPSFKSGSSEHDGTLVTITYKEPISPSSPLRFVHALDTVQAVEENRAVSENVPSAQWEDKAMTLRSRRSEGSRLVAERIGPAQGEAALAVTPEQNPRYLRVGALQKWSTADLDQDADMEKGTPKESQRDVALDKDRQKLAEQEEVTAAPKRLKILQAEDQPKPRATYFALTGQLQEPVSPITTEANMGDMTALFDDFTMRSAFFSSQGKILSFRRNPSLDQAFEKTLKSQDQAEESLMRNPLSHREIRSALNAEMTEEIMEDEKKRDPYKVTERQQATMKEPEREIQRRLELEKQARLEYARKKEREMQREFERQRQKAFENEKQLALERQQQIELEKQKFQELERDKQREQERERQQQLEREKQQALERQREAEREKLREQERERQKQREEERQRELDKERHLLEIQKEKQKMEELERIKELERQQLLDFQKQKQKEMERQQIIELEKQRLREKNERKAAEKIRQMAIEQEMLKLKELEKERERQREIEKEHQKEIEREKQRELERQRQRDLDRDRQRQLDIERQELENQRLRQRELEKERQKKEELERIKEMEKKQLLELEKLKQAEIERQQIIELEKRRLREKMEREEAEKMRLVAKQQEAERQRLKEKQKKEEQERAKLESSPLRPQVVDLDSVFRNETVSKATSPHSDPSPYSLLHGIQCKSSTFITRLSLLPFILQVQQKQRVRGEEEGKDSETLVHETDSQYGTWETGLRTDDSSLCIFSLGLHVQVPTTLLDTSALRSRAQLGKKRAPRTRPSRAVRQSVAEGATGTDEEWLYRDSTEVKVENKDDDSDSEEQSRVADFSPAVASQPQRIAMFPGMDPSALMAQLKKRGDSDSQVDGSTPSPSQLSRSPKSPFLPRAAEENSPQWLKELKSKKRLSQYETES